MTQHQNPPHSPFLWAPGKGQDANALARMQRYAPRPSTAMGEAWFLGEEREVYTSLLEMDVVDQAVEDLQDYLVEIALGLHNFGHADAWADWYQYLLPRCVHRSFDHHVDYLVEYLVTAFMAMMPDSSKPCGYASFVRDAETGSKANRIHFEETVMDILGERLLSEWLESLKEFEHLFDQVTAAAIPDKLHRYYRF